MIRINRSETLELEGTYVEFPDVEEPELEAVVSELPDNFTDLLSLVAPIINRNEYRRVLQGVNLSADGITATDGRQLLHLDCPLNLEKNLTIPFSSVLKNPPKTNLTLCDFMIEFLFVSILKNQSSIQSSSKADLTNVILRTSFVSWGMDYVFLLFI